jgi:hypothetical protein
MTFLILRLGLEAALGVWADEMQLYKSCEVGAEYVWGLTDMRTIRVDDGRGERGGMMFLAAMFNFDVASVTLPIHQPLTVLGYWIEWWARNLIIPWMVLRGKKFIVFDNARVHRRQFLRLLFRAAGIEVYFSPRVLSLVLAYREDVSVHAQEVLTARELHQRGLSLRGA